MTSPPPPTPLALSRINTSWQPPIGSRLFRCTSPASSASPVKDRDTFPRLHLPADTAPHAGTVMCWPTEASILHEVECKDGSDVEATREEVASIARIIARYEPVRLFVHDSMPDIHVHDERCSDLQSARSYLNKTSNITIHPTPNVHCLWARDTGPVFVHSLDDSVSTIWSYGAVAGRGFDSKDTTSRVVGILLGFNQWGRKRAPSSDTYFAPLVCETLAKSAIQAQFISEGGAIEVDGKGTLLATESSLLNPNRNPGVTKGMLERYFSEVFGIRKTIWIPGRCGRDITDDHIDTIARFGQNGMVILSKPFLADSPTLLQLERMQVYEETKNIINTETAADGYPLQSIDLPEPNPVQVLQTSYAPQNCPCVSYVNFYTVNGAVIVAAFGDTYRDSYAARIIAEQFPGRVVEQATLRQLAIQGGGIHCATQQILPEKRESV